VRFELSARDKIREFFDRNVGVVVTTQQISEIAGIRDYARRIRELRDEEGMQIRSHVDRHDLKPGEYVLESLYREPAIARSISPQLRMQILERNGFTCRLCGATASDPDPYNPNRKVRLHVDHVIPISQGGTDDPSNLRTTCSTCNQGRSNLHTPSEAAFGLLARIRKASRSVQKEVYEAMKRSFGD
jgi:HNH endonuclease